MAHEIMDRDFLLGNKHGVTRTSGIEKGWVGCIDDEPCIALDISSLCFTRTKWDMGFWSRGIGSFPMIGATTGWNGMGLDGIGLRFWYLVDEEESFACVGGRAAGYLMIL
jgi:hypothetical protein